MESVRCCDDQRRFDLAASASLNGIDFVEVVDVGDQFQQGLRVHFLRAPAPAGITAANVAILGGDRITGLSVDRDPVHEGDVLVLHVDAPGDFSTYVLALVRADGSGLPMDGLDPVFFQCAFSFKVDCPTSFDVAAAPACQPVVERAPALDYLAKDYDAFRQAMLDRLAVLVPDWQETHAADLGLVLVETLAYVADQLSYHQDAVATEAALANARLRTSVRRHARLVDYFMHEGAGARTWVIVSVAAEGVLLPAHTRLLGGGTGDAARPAVLPTARLPEALAGNPTVFETMQDATLSQSLATLPFHTWGGLRCALPQGSTRATLRGRFGALRPGDVLVFEERLGPLTGQPADADPQHSQAVRLVEVTLDDALGNPLVDALYDQPLTEIAWAAEDALAFPLCLSARVLQGATEFDVADVSIARGNVVLADHGRRIAVAEDLGEVPAPTLFRAPVTSGDGCTRQPPLPVPARYRPRLAAAPLAWNVPFESGDATRSATALLAPVPADALPAVQLTGSLGGASTDWFALRDLLASGAQDNVFVVEPDDAGVAWLRFGDATHGRRPPSGMRFQAIYRVGGGAAGNVGARTLAQIVSDDPAITGVSQPLPACGGVAPETLASVRANAPFALRTPLRAVTADDYGRMATALPGVQSAAATLRWTGSWHTVFVSAEKLGGAELTAADRSTIAGALESVRMAGLDLEVEAPTAVPLDIEMIVTAQADHFRADVALAVARVFSARVLPDGRLGLFHPDNFVIGQDVYASPLYAAAMAIPGVASVQLVRFQRRDGPDPASLATGVLPIGRIELARLDNDPDFPERGVFTFSVEGGK